MVDLELISKLSDSYIFVKDRKLKFLYCNENAAESLGLDSPNQITGKNDGNFFEEPLADSYRLCDSQILQGKRLLKFIELYAVRGEVKYVLTTKKELRDKEGVVTGVLVSSTDITGIGLQTDTQNLGNLRYGFKVGRQWESFTKGEFRVFQLLIRNFTSKQIAEVLDLSYRTVEDYIKRIRSKLQCENKQDIIDVAIRNGIVFQSTISQVWSR